MFLHIVLLILKILGIILLVLAAIPFIPFRYQLKVVKDKDKDIERIEARFSWLFKFYSGIFLYENGDSKFQNRILGVKLKSKEKKIDSPVKKKEKKKYTFQMFCDMMKSIRNGLKATYDFITNMKHQRAFRLIAKESITFFKKAKPKKIQMELEYGFDDPYQTGKVLGALSIAKAWYGDTIFIKPDFENAKFRLNFDAKGRVFGISLLIYLYKIYFDDSVEQTIRDFKITSRKIKEDFKHVE